MVRKKLREIIYAESPTCHSIRENTLKRTRRVEVIRYSRRSTVISDEAAFETDLAEKQPGIEALLGMHWASESEDACRKPTHKRELAGAKADEFVPRTGLLRLLKRFIRG